MTAFVSRRIIKSKKLGEKLKEARAERGINLDRAAKDLNIAFKYLEALENDNFDGLPGKAYAKIFLKRYCEYLRLDFGDCWAEAKKLEIKTKADQKIKSHYFFAWQKTVKLIFALVLVCSVLIFFAFKIYNIFAPPSLSVSSPQDGFITSERQIKIEGQSLPEVELVVNNNNIFVDSAGRFETLVDLQKGLNLIKIMAKKKYSRTREVDIRVLLKDEQN